MSTTTGTIDVYDSFKGFKGDGTIDLDTDTFVCGLCTSGYTPNKSAHELLADIVNEVSGNGYARQTLTGVVWTEPSPGVWRFDSDDAVFTASGGSITARWWFVFDDTAAGDPLFAYGLLDNANDDVVTTDGNTLTVRPNVAGWFQESGG